MNPKKIENLRVEVRSIHGAPSVDFELGDRRYHVWMRGENLETTLHSNARDVTVPGKHVGLDLMAKKYAALRMAIIAFATPDRVAEARQAAADKEAAEEAEADKKLADKMRAALLGEADQIEADNPSMFQALRGFRSSVNELDQGQLIRLYRIIRSI